MRIRIDVDACQGHNRCAMTYPEIFGVHDDVTAFVHVDQIPREWEKGRCWQSRIAPSVPSASPNDHAILEARAPSWQR